MKKTKNPKMKSATELIITKDNLRIQTDPHTHTHNQTIGKIKLESINVSSQFKSITENNFQNSSCSIV